MLPDRRLLIGQKWLENAKIQKFKCDILGDFQTLCSTKDYCGGADFGDFLIGVCGGSCFVNGSHSNTIMFEQKKSGKSSGNLFFLASKVEERPLLFALLSSAVQLRGYRARVGGG